MAPMLDGFAVLRAIGTHPDVFSGLSTDEVTKAATKLVAQQMKASASKLGSVHKIGEAIGIENLRAIIANIGEKDVDAVLKGLDKDHSATADRSAKRARLVALAGGTAEPGAPDDKAAKRRLTSKTVDLGTIRELCASFEREQFETVLETLSEAQARTLIQKIDRNNPQLPTASASWLRGHAMALAAGLAEPAEMQGDEDDTGSPWSEAIDVALRPRK